MEGVVVKHNQSVVVGVWGIFHNNEILIKCEVEFCVTGKVGFHLDVSIDSPVEYVTIVAEEYIEVLEDIDKCFIFCLAPLEPCICLWR